MSWGGGGGSAEYSRPPLHPTRRAGGRRCKHEGCNKAARDMFFCAGHGGGRRCMHEGCGKGAVGASSMCTAHGGGRRCLSPGCPKSAQSGTSHCGEEREGGSSLPTHGVSHPTQPLSEARWRAEMCRDRLQPAFSQQRRHVRAVRGEEEARAGGWCVRGCGEREAEVVKDGPAPLDASRARVVGSSAVYTAPPCTALCYSSQAPIGPPSRGPWRSGF